MMHFRAFLCCFVQNRVDSCIGFILLHIYVEVNTFLQFFVEEVTNGTIG